MDNSLTQFAKFLNFYQSPLMILVRLIVFVSLLFLVFNFANSGLSLKGPLFFLSLFFILEVFVKFKIERTPPSKITFLVAKLLTSCPETKSLVKKLLRMKNIKFFLQKCDIKPLEVVLVEMDKNELLAKSAELIKSQSLPFVSSTDLMLTYLILAEPTTKLLFKKELKTPDLLNIGYWTRMHFREEPQKIRVKLWGQGIGEGWVSGWTLETQKYTLDFTKKALRGEKGFYGREKELNALIDVLLKSEKQNAILVGEPGVGKTAIVRALALKLFSGEVPSPLSHKHILELSVGSLLSGAENQGILEERIKNIITELEHSGSVILYIPEIQNIAGATSLKFDATGVLLPLLSGDKVQVVATTTPQNYKTFIEGKTSFAAAFEKIEVLEPEREVCLKMLEEVALTLERKHQVNITYQAVVTACDLARKYLPDRFLPGKAINLLDEAGAEIALEKSGKKDLERQDIISLIEAKTHVAVGKPGKQERETLLNLEKILHRRIINQDEAVRTVSEALRRLRGGVTFEDRPVGTFLFLGPTGVGKTETAKALASVYFGREEAMIRLDMSEYQNEGSVNRLLGPPPGGAGFGEGWGELTEEVREKPFSLVLLDEFEKAHPRILDLFLQVFEDGRLTDNRGRTVSFINTIIIATSNAAAESIREKVKAGLNLQKLKPLILEELQRSGVFKPELLNRFDSVVLFEPLGEREAREVTRLLLLKLANSLKKKDIEIKFDDTVVAKIAREGFDPTLGGRPLRRFIQDNIENLIAQKILKEEIKRGNVVTFSTDSANNLTLAVTGSL